MADPAAGVAFQAVGPLVLAWEMPDVNAFEPPQLHRARARWSDAWARPCGHPVRLASQVFAVLWVSGCAASVQRAVLSEGLSSIAWRHRTHVGLPMIR